MSPAEQLQVAEAALATVAAKARDPALRAGAVDLLIGVSRMAGRAEAEESDEGEAPAPQRRSA